LSRQDEVAAKKRFKRDIAITDRGFGQDASVFQAATG
jgi:hypothetical protein